MNEILDFFLRPELRGIDWAYYTDLMSRMLSAKRLEHSLKVAETGVEMSRLYGGAPDKIALAGLLHDCAKEMKDRELLDIAAEARLITDPSELENPSVLHGPVGAWLAETQWCVKDPIVLEAIRYHTTAAPYMSLEACIVFMADLIEPGRSYHGIAELRELAQVDLKLAMLESIDQTFIFLERKKVPVHQGMVACRKWLTETDFGHRIDRPEQPGPTQNLKGDPNEQ